MPPLDTIKAIMKTKQEESLRIEESGLPRWQEPFISFIKYGILPSETNERANIRRRAPCFYDNETMNVLYYQSYDGILKKCLNSREALETLEEMHKGVCGAHQSGPKLYARVRRQGYY